ncbi:doublecortin domain-containing protein 2B isoform X1 [Protopterus annectens]|uniref:doublecortin domain-containing protein 2B isoform X1 n=1 Tax=Protopterus annectens TaxID=7888 RepID=UPI001CFB43D8|nr:doublecortin domain-containing protein 2B isoform X1 [Protopterus annectens]
MTSTLENAIPHAKNVVIYRNGDPFFTGRKLVVNQRQFLTFEAFLNEVTSDIQAPVAVRNLYTPKHGHKVQELEELQNGCHYVAGGFEKFKKVDYSNTTGKKHTATQKKDGTEIRTASNRPSDSARWRKHLPIPCIINVFRNGDLQSPPFRLLLPKKMLKEWEMVLSMLTEKANLHNGAVRKLCTLEGIPVMSGDQLESGHYYVAVGMEKYKDLPYVELLVSKNSRRNIIRNHQATRHNDHKDEIRKSYTISQDGASDTALLETREKQPDSRRVQSTGANDEAGILISPQPVRRNRKNASSEEESVFHGKPVRVKHQKTVQDDPQSLTKSQEDGVFRMKGSRSEIRGAQEVKEDGNTRTEVPIDQRPAEVVKDEALLGMEDPPQLEQNTER